MRGIQQIVADMGLQLTEEQVKDLDSKVRENYVTRNEHDEKLRKLASLTEQVGELTAKVNDSAEASDKVAALQRQVAEYQEAEARREQEEADRRAREGFEVSFSEAVGERRFANEMTRQHVLDKAYEMHRANPDMAVASIVDEAASGDGVWASPQADPKNMPSPQAKDSQAEMGAFAAALFGEARSK